MSNWRILYFRCLLPVENLENATFSLPENLLSFSYPMDPATSIKRAKPSQCRKYDINVPPTVTTLEQYYTFAGNDTQKWNITSCENYVYNRSVYTSTVVSEVRIYIYFLDWKHFSPFHCAIFQNLFPNNPGESLERNSVRAFPKSVSKSFRNNLFESRLMQIGWKSFQIWSFNPNEFKLNFKSESILVQFYQNWFFNSD